MATRFRVALGPLTAIAATMMSMGTALGQVIAADAEGVASELIPATTVPISPEAAAGSTWPIALAAGAAILLFLVIRGWRLPATLREPLPIPGVLLALAVAMLLAAPIGVAVALGLAPPDADADDSALRSQGTAMLGAYAAQAAIVAVWWRLRRKHARTDTPPDNASARRSIGLGIVTVAIAWPIVATVFGIVAWLRVRMTATETEQLAHQTLQALDAGGGGGWAIAVTLLSAIAAPFFEEVLFRGMLQPALRAIGISPWTAIALVAAIFAVVHWSAVPPPGIAALFVLGLAFGWARERSGGLVAPIVAHAIFNAGNLALAAAIGSGA